jgi:hypothetical protein
MTTRIHIVNFGPDVVEVETPQAVVQQIFQNSYKDFYVYDQHDVIVREVKLPHGLTVETIRELKNQLTSREVKFKE